jgi:hypothetical protein
MTDDAFNGWDRRKLITGVGVAFLAVRYLPSCSRTVESASEKNRSAENLLIHSSRGFVGHSHDLLIPYAVLNAPPLEGIRLESTPGLFHTHSVALTREQLVNVRREGTVTVVASSHTFLISLHASLG